MTPLPDEGLRHPRDVMEQGPSEPTPLPSELPFALASSEQETGR